VTGPKPHYCQKPRYFHHWYSTVTTVSYRYSRGGLVLSTYTPYVCGVKTLRINVAVLYADRRVRYTTSQESDFHRESLLPDLECTVWPINTLMTLKRQNITEKQNICLVDSKYKCMLCYAIMSCAVLFCSILELCCTAHTHRRELVCSSNLCNPLTHTR
jgi:hypothetical protein